mgnify:CR=1 FL=1
MDSEPLVLESLGDSVVMFPSPFGVMDSEHALKEYDPTGTGIVSVPFRDNGF